MLRAALCFLAGLAVAFAGWRLVKSQEVPPGDTRFVHFWSPTVLLINLGYLLLFTGLMLCCIFTPMFWIARPR